jgi:recombination protein RecA
MFDEGISASGDLVDLGVEDGIISKSGAWFSYGDMRLGQGRENAKQFLRENEDLFQEIRHAVMIKRGMVAAQSEQTAEKGAENEPTPVETK